MKSKDLLIVIVLFYIGWFGCVLLAQTKFSALSMSFPILLIVFLYFTKYLTPKSLAFAGLIFALGVAFDFLMIYQGWIQIPGEKSLPNPFYFPVWLFGIWLLFAFSMIVIAPKFKAPLPLAVILGAIMGPLSYKSGEVFQVLSFSSSTTFLIYAVFWGTVFPLSLHLSKRFL